jgi:Na+-driven multidrug efflux pump
LRGLQDTKMTLGVAVGSNLINLALEVLLIYGLGMGIAASAAATVVAQYLAAGAYLFVLVRNVRAREVPLRPDARRLRALVVVGRDLFLRTGSLLAALAVATAVASRLGTIELAAHQIAFQLWSFLALVLDAVAIAGQAMIGRMLGAEQPDEARSAAPLFTDDASVAADAMRVLIVVAILQPINGIVFVLDGVLIGAGDLRFLAKAMAASSIVFVPAALLVLWRDESLVALWGALALLMMVRLTGNMARFVSSAWQVVGAERT